MSFQDVDQLALDPDSDECFTIAWEFGDLVGALGGGSAEVYAATDLAYNTCMEGGTVTLQMAFED